MDEPICEICGKRTARAVILIEGAKMLACGGCMRGGKVIHRLSFEEKGSVVAAPASKVQAEEEVVDDYAPRIRKARQKMGLPVAVVAERINEKRSHLEAVESGRIRPTLATARKLEKELNIKLVEKPRVEVAPSVSKKAKFSEPTLADMIETKKEK